MNIQYRTYPIDYIQALHNQGKREKARCFWEYWHDVQMKEVNAISFYAKSWGVHQPKSKGTVHKWIKEFVSEIQKFYDTQSLYNTQHYSSVKKQSERKVNANKTKKQPQSTATPSVDKIEKTQSERKVNEVNIIDNNIHVRERAWFDNFYFIYRMNNKYAGKKNDAYELFKKMDIQDPKLLTLAGLRYCHDDTVDRKVGAKRFLEDEIYLSYTPKIITVKIADEWITGEYDSDKEVFTDANHNNYILTADKLVEKFSKGELDFVRDAA